MYLVKSCYAPDNVFLRKTIKIGSLEDYRKIEEEQIVDKHEGKLNLYFDFLGLHLDDEIHTLIMSHNNAFCSIYLEEGVTLGPSPILKDSTWVPLWRGYTSFEHHNQFVFCMSKLTEAGLAKGLFKEYDDLWYFNYDKRFFIAQLMAINIKKEILKKIHNGEKVFKGDIDIDSLQVWYLVQEIEYVDRSIVVDNIFYYTNQEKLKQIIKGMVFLKPESFSREKEVRFLFGVSSSGKYVSPLINSLIIDAEEIIHFIKR